MFKFFVSAILFAFAVTASAKERELGFFRGNSRNLEITVTNIAYQQVMSPFFYMVHSRDASPLFELGKEASGPLADLAENGLTEMLETMYNPETNDNVLSANFLGGPLLPGASTSFEVTINRNFPYISFASMAVNTNDCFVGINGIFFYNGQSLTVPGYDAGSEINNELCNSIPGPVCAGISGDNEASGEGEGFVQDTW